MRRLEKVTIWSHKSVATQATKLTLDIWFVIHQHLLSTCCEYNPAMGTVGEHKRLQRPFSCLQL